MNKILKTVASAAVAVFGFSAFAELPSVTADFEGLSLGEKTMAGLVTRDDDGATEGTKYWFAVTNTSTKVEEDVIGVVTNNAHDSQYLSLDTTLPIYRTINVAPDAYGDAPAGFTGEDISGGIYLDTMVKFTPADDVFKDSDLDEGDKIAISYVGESDSGITNKIVVRAGYVDGSTITPTNYIMNVPAEVDVTNWCHLIVRTIANVGSANAPVGFAIYLNDSPNPLTYDTGVEAGDQNYVDSLTGVAKAYLYTDSVHALLPSLVNTGIDKAKLSAVGFKGNGCIDDVAFKAGKPGFITEDITVTIAWDAGVATYTVLDNNNNTITNAAATGGSAGSVEFKLDPIAVSDLTVTATYDTANGYEADTWTVDGTGASISGSTFTVADGATLNINSMLPKFDVGGTHYGTFSAALTAAKGTSLADMGTIKLLADVTADNEVSGYVIIDLAGKTLTGVTDGAIINDGANLFITNSTAEVGHVKAGTASQAVLLTGGATVIYAGYFDGEVYVDGGNLMLYGGYYLDTVAAGNPEDFYLADYAQDTVAYADNDYFQVGESAEPPSEGWVNPTDVSAMAEIAGKTAGEAYGITGDLAAADATKLTVWATANSVAFSKTGEGINVPAFLLNIAPDAADQTFEPASITMEGGKVVISANQTLTAVNGKVYVKVATTLAGLATAEWTEATLDEGKVQVTPGSSDTAGFYKIKVDF